MTGGAAPAIWLGDAVRATCLLAPTAETTREVLELLGLRRPPPVVAPPTPRSGPPADEVRPADRPAGVRRGEVLPPVDAPTPPPRITDRAQARPPSVETLPGAAPDPPEDLPGLDDVLRAVTAPRRLAPDDLLDPNRQRAIIGGLCSSPAPTGDLDLQAVVDRMVAGRPVIDLPQTVRPTTRRGVQLLVDIGPAMLPFSRDQDAVRRSVELIAGPDGLEVITFRGHPLSPHGAGTGPMWTWTSYRPPAGGVPAVALSDLGALGPSVDRAAVQAGWRRLAGQMREAGCGLVALVPVPAERIPRDLRRAIDVVVWDRTTTVRDAVAAVRRSAARTPRLGPWSAV